tara:strand:+ start:1066 stop:2097 length:1032 start_codon:yes stop_codon:yes gene_type:complete
MIIKNEMKGHTKQSLMENNGKIISEATGLLVNQVAWENKNNQTRSGDLDVGHIASLTLDIKDRGLENRPIVEFNSETGLYRIVSGHHRLEALRRIIQEEGASVEKIPVSVVSFNNKFDRQFFMQEENHHQPVKGHNKKDAIRFIKVLRKEGYFDSAEGDIDTLRVMTDKVMAKYYYRIKGKTLQDVFLDSFKDKEITRVLTVVNGAAKDHIKRHYKDSKPFEWSSNEYLCWGDSNSSRKAIAVGLEKRVKALDNGDIRFSSKKGKIKVVTYFSSKDAQELKEKRLTFLSTQRLLNKYAFGPGNLIIVSEVAFIPQVEGRKGIKEDKMIVYRWSSDLEEFTKRR